MNSDKIITNSSNSSRCSEESQVLMHFLTLFQKIRKAGYFWKEGSVRFSRTEIKHVLKDLNIHSFRNNINMGKAAYSLGSMVVCRRLMQGGTGLIRRFW